MAISNASYFKILFLTIIYMLFSPAENCRAANESVVFNGFEIKQNKMVDGHRCFRANLDITILNYANHKATVTLQLEDSKGNILSTAEGLASITKSLNLKGTNEARFSSLKFNISNQRFLTSSRIGKTLYARFILKIDGKTVMQGHKDFIAERVSSSNSATKQPTPRSSNDHKHDDNSNESITNYRTWTVKCPLCQGDGLCHVCWGNKEYYSPAAKMMWPCSPCYGSGKCRMCEGRKVNTYTAWTENGIHYMMINGGKKIVIGQYKDDGRKCGACHGYKRCQVCQGSGEAVSYVAGERIQCSACKGSGECFKCGGTGWR